MLIKIFVFLRKICRCSRPSCLLFLPTSAAGFRAIPPTLSENFRNLQHLLCYQKLRHANLPHFILTPLNFSSSFAEGGINCYLTCAKNFYATDTMEIPLEECNGKVLHRTYFWRNQICVQKDFNVNCLNLKKTFSLSFKKRSISLRELKRDIL